MNKSKVERQSFYQKIINNLAFLLTLKGVAFRVDMIMYFFKPNAIFYRWWFFYFVSTHICMYIFFSEIFPFKLPRGVGSITTHSPDHSSPSTSGEGWRMFSAMRSKIYFQVGLWVSVPGQHQLCRLLPAKVKTMLIKKLGILSSKCRIYSSLQLFSTENLCFSWSRSGYCGLRLSAGTGSFIVNSNLAGNMVTMIIMMVMMVMMMC